jgi:hypothetical protein
MVVDTSVYSEDALVHKRYTASSKYLTSPGRYRACIYKEEDMNYTS